jgi:PAS domain S-box-containing protein
MCWQYPLYTFPLFLIAGIAVTLALFVWRRRAAPGAMALMVLILAATIWSLAYALELVVIDLTAKLFWARVQYLGIATVPLAWMIFAFQYTNRDQWLTGRNLALLGVIPVITVLLVWTNEWHGLVWSHTELNTDGSFPMLSLTHGPWFWGYWFFSYLLLVLGSIQVLLTLWRSPQFYRRQAAGLLIGLLMPWVANGLYVLNLEPLPNLDLTPLAFTLSGLAFAHSFFRYRLLDIVPVARRSVVDGMSDGVVVLDTQNRIVDLNPAAEQLIGYPAVEVIGKPVEHMPVAYAEFVEQYQDITEGYAEITLSSDVLGTRFEPRPGDKEDAPHHYELRISPLTDQEGHLVARVVVLHEITACKQAEAALRAARDELEARVEERTEELARLNRDLLSEIAERVRMEQALKQSEEKYRLLAENVTDVIWAMDLALRFIYVSPSVSALRGYTAEESMNQSMDEVLTPASVQVAMETLAEELEKERSLDTPDPKRSIVLELEHSCKGGGTVPVEIKMTFLRNEAGQPVGILGVTRDITERRQAEAALRESEEKFRGVFEQSSDAIVLTDEEGVIIAWNRAAEHITGRKEADVMGKYFWDVQFELLPEEGRTPAAREQFYATMSQALHTGQATWLNRLLEGQLQHPDGKRVYFQQVAFPIQTAKGFMLGSVIRDMTQRVSAEAEIRRLNEELEGRVVERTAQLEAAYRELEAASYTISHDLRAPLRAIDGFAQILLEDYGGGLPAPAREHLGRISRGAQHMGGLIDGLLAFLRLGRQVLVRQPVSPAHLVQEAWGELEAEWQGRRVEFRVGQLPECEADPDLLRRVYFHLLANALKYTRQRAVAEIEAGWQQEADQTLYFVRDNGAGFDMAYADRLFGVFQRLHPGEGYEGTGIGLAIVQRIVHRHGGRVWAEAEVDKGATIYFVL